MQEWEHDPAVLAKNLGIDTHALDPLPRQERFIFQAEPPPPRLEADAVHNTLGAVR